MNFKNLAVPVKQMLGYLMMRNAWRQLDALQDLRAYSLQVRLDFQDNPARTASAMTLEMRSAKLPWASTSWLTSSSRANNLTV